jgi:hypothetical protein
LLTAVAQDDKEQLVLIEYAKVDLENFDNWTYFFSHLNAVFNFNHVGIIIISNQECGLKSAAENVFSLAFKSHRLRHLAANLKLKFRNKILINKF